jgi:cellulose synthase (UDP-forming)
MTNSEFNSPSLGNPHPGKRQKLQVATIVTLATAFLATGIAGAWFAGEKTISHIFAQLRVWQENPPLLLQAPPVAGEYLLAFAVALFLLANALTKISPKPRTTAGFILVGIMLALTIRYALWRTLSTLNLATPLNGVFSLGLFFLEMVTVLMTLIQLCLVVTVKDRHSEADLLEPAVKSGKFAPSFDILIPTYNEDAFILRRTIVGCQALEYAHKKIYLLDDTRRPEMQRLAEELGCEYLTRPDNQHAKAGNLNHALTKTSGELIAVFDADFIPTRNFITRTAGFFQDQRVGLVQTPQSYYKFEPIARNLGLENVIFPEEEMFYRLIQPIRDSVGAVVCTGTSFVVRRSALEEIGGFVTDSVCEDYFTGIRISARGYQLIYLDEKLSAGLATEDMATQISQRLRWTQGSLQAFFLDDNPLIIPGLNPLQRLGYLEGLLSRFAILSRAAFLLAPLAYSLLGAIPVRANLAELLYFFLPYYLVYLAGYSWLTQRSRSLFLSDMYDSVHCIPLAISVIQVMLNPFAKGFQVTPKGISKDHFSFNWTSGLPLLVLLAATAAGVWRILGGQVPAWPEMAEFSININAGLIWSAYNLLIIAVALLSQIEAPNPEISQWFDLRRTVRLDCAGQTFWGVTTAISEVGVEVLLSKGIPTDAGEPLLVKLEIMEEALPLQGRISHTGTEGEFPTVRVTFEGVSQSQYRQLVQMLFCRAGQWKRLDTPGDLQSLWLLLRALLQPRALSHRNRQLRALSVSKV